MHTTVISHRSILVISPPAAVIRSSDRYRPSIQDLQLLQSQAPALDGRLLVRKAVIARCVAVMVSLLLCADRKNVRGLTKTFCTRRSMKLVMPPPEAQGLELAAIVTGFSLLPQQGS